MHKYSALEKHEKKAAPTQQAAGEEYRLLSDWVLSENGEKAIKDDIESKWETPTTEAGTRFDSRKVYRNVRRRMNGGHRNRLRRLVRYTAEFAAVVLIAFGAAYFLGDNIVRHEIYPKQVEIYNPKGLRTTITLPDSSVVTLNSDTRLSYEGRFDGGQRSVKLEGEAFFEVASDVTRPFIVETRDAKMTVLGTSFNVRSYSDDAIEQTTLLEGSLRVNIARKEEVLTPGSQITLDRAAYTTSLIEVDTDRVVGWMEGRLYFSSSSFEEIARTLERSFGTNITINNAHLRSRLFNGKFERGENLDQILAIMRTSVPFENHYDKEINTIIIY